MQNLIFSDPGLVPFFCWLKVGGSISKNAKLTDHCMFCLSGFIHFDETDENHELNTSYAFIL